MGYAFHKKLIGGIIFILFTFIKIYAQINISLLNGLAIPSGKVHGPALWDFEPYSFNAGTFYLDSYELSLSIGYTFPLLLKGRVSSEISISQISLKLSNTGQLISDASTGYTEKTNTAMQSIDFRGIYHLFKKNNKKVSPYLGLGARINSLVVIAEGYEPERMKQLNPLIIAGTDIKIHSGKKRPLIPFIRLETCWSQAMEISTIPATIQCLAGMNFMMR